MSGQSDHPRNRFDVFKHISDGIASLEPSLDLLNCFPDKRDDFSIGSGFMYTSEYGFMYASEYGLRSCVRFLPEINNRYFFYY